MLGTLHRLLCGQEKVAGRAGDGHALKMATAALLMEVADADHDISQAEREAIRSIVEQKFDVTAEEAIAIIRQVEQEAGHVTSVHPFTRRIVNGCSMEERIEIVDMLWRVTVADGSIDAHETHLVRKIADLLYVPHSQFIRTRLANEDR